METQAKTQQEEQQFVECINCGKPAALQSTQEGGELGWTRYHYACPHCGHSEADISIAPAMIECFMPNQRAVRALIAGGYTCEQVGPFLYRTNAPLKQGVAFRTGGETLKLQGDMVFPMANERDRAWLERAKEGETT